MSGANRMPLSRCDRLSSRTSVRMRASGIAIAIESVAGCSAGGFHGRGLLLLLFLLRRKVPILLVCWTESGKLDRVGSIIVVREAQILQTSNRTRRKGKKKARQKEIVKRAPGYQRYANVHWHHGALPVVHKRCSSHPCRDEIAARMGTNCAAAPFLLRPFVAMAAALRVAAGTGYTKRNTLLAWVNSASLCCSLP